MVGGSYEIMLCRLVIQKESFPWNVKRVFWLTVKTGAVQSTLWKRWMIAAKFQPKMTMDNGQRRERKTKNWDSAAWIKTNAWNANGNLPELISKRQHQVHTWLVACHSLGNESLHIEAPQMQFALMFSKIILSDRFLLPKCNYSDF